MNKKEIELRLAAIKAILSGEGECNIEELETEVRSLQTQKSEFEAVEKRAKIAADIADGKIEPDAVIKKEERKVMEFVKETVLNTPEYRSAYLKHMQGKDLNETEQRAYSTAATFGAEVIPTITANLIMKKVFVIAPVLEHMTNLFHVPSNFSFAIEGTNADAAMHVENAAITPSNDTLVTMSLAAYEVTKALRMSRTVSAMAIDAFEGFIVQLLADNMAKKLESLVFTGTGAAMATGLVKAGQGASGAYTAGIDQTTVNTAVAVVEADILGWYGQVGNFQNAKAYMSKLTFLNYIYPIMNNAKNISVKFLDGMFYIMDAPVFFTNTLPLGTGYLAAMDQFIGNFAEDINVRRSNESGFLNNSIDYLAVCAFDCKPIVGNGAFAKLVKTP